MLIQLVGLFEQDDDHRGIVQLLKQIAEQTKETKTLQSKRDRTKRLGDRRKHLKKQVREDVATIDSVEEKLKTHGEALGEKWEKPNTPKKYMQRHLWTYMQRVCRIFGGADGGDETQDAEAVTPKATVPPAASGSAPVATPGCKATRSTCREC